MVRSGMRSLFQANKYQKDKGLVDSDDDEDVSLNFDFDDHSCISESSGLDFSQVEGTDFNSSQIDLLGEPDPHYESPTARSESAPKAVVASRRNSLDAPGIYSSYLPDKECPKSAPAIYRNRFYTTEKNKQKDESESESQHTFGVFPDESGTEYQTDLEDEDDSGFFGEGLLVSTPDSKTSRQSVQNMKNTSMALQAPLLSSAKKSPNTGTNNGSKKLFASTPFSASSPHAGQRRASLSNVPLHSANEPPVPGNLGLSPMDGKRLIAREDFIQRRRDMAAEAEMNADADMKHFVETIAKAKPIRGSRRGSVKNQRKTLESSLSEIEADFGPPEVSSPTGRKSFSSYGTGTTASMSKSSGSGSYGSERRKEQSSVGEILEYDSYSEDERLYLVESGESDIDLSPRRRGSAIQQEGSKRSQRSAYGYRRGSCDSGENKTRNHRPAKSNGRRESQVREYRNKQSSSEEDNRREYHHRKKSDNISHRRSRRTGSDFSFQSSSDDGGHADERRHRRYRKPSRNDTHNTSGEHSRRGMSRSDVDTTDREDEGVESKHRRRGRGFSRSDVDTSDQADDKVEKYHRRGRDRGMSRSDTNTSGTDEELMERNRRRGQSRTRASRQSHNRHRSVSRARR